MARYRYAMEFEALGSAIYFLWSYMWKYDEPSFSLFKMESEVIRQQVPECERHKYIGDFGPIEWILLELLYLSPDRKGFLQVIERVKKLYLDQEGNKER